MTDSVISASPGDSTPPDNTTPSNILERLELYKEANPTATEYWLETEAEAELLLVAMAASLDTLIDDPSFSRVGADDLKTYSRKYKAMCRQQRALEYIRDLGDNDSLAIWGMRIRARRIVLQ